MQSKTHRNTTTRTLAASLNDTYIYIIYIKNQVDSAYLGPYLDQYLGHLRDFPRQILPLWCIKDTMDKCLQ